MLVDKERTGKEGGKGSTAREGLEIQKTNDGWAGENKAA